MKYWYLRFFFSFVLVGIESCTPPSFEQTGGTRVTLMASMPEDMKPDELVSVMEKVKLVLAGRLEKFGITNVNFKPGETTNYLIVEIPRLSGGQAGNNDNQRLRKLLVGAARLEFWETYESQQLYSKLTDLNKQLGTEVVPAPDTAAEVEVQEGMSMDEQFAAQKSEKEKAAENLEKMKKENPIFALLTPEYSVDERGQVSGIAGGPSLGMALVKDTAALGELLSGESAKQVFGPYVKFLWTAQQISPEQPALRLIAVKANRTGKAAMWDNIIEEAKVLDDDGSIRVSMQLNKFATSDWAKLTRDNVGKAIAIVVDGYVYSYPTVQGEIAGGKAEIWAGFSREEADDFAALLNAGNLPIRLSIVQEDVVGPGGK